MDPVDKLIEAASRKHLVELQYKKPTQKKPSPRLVEPYTMQISNSGNKSVRCWQVDPKLGTNGWKNFRTDRIVDARDSGVPFDPRGQVTLLIDHHDQLTSGNSSTYQFSPEDHYLHFLDEVILEGVLTDSGIAQARRMAKGMGLNSMRGVHARVYRDVLDEVLIDGQVDAEELEYLNEVQGFLRQLGWCPGDPV